MRAKNIFVCGGDIRSKYIAQYFKSKNYQVTTFGHGESGESYEGLQSADVVVLGLPATKEDRVYMPMSQEKLFFSELLHRCSPNAIVCGGRFASANRLEADRRKIRLWDYSEDEIFQLENAFYTAEGALARIIENTAISAGHCSILVAGYGRIGKALATLMSGSFWHLCIYARRAESRAEIGAKGINTISEVSNLGEYDVIINTVPHGIFDEASLSTIRTEALIMDLSASPGYVDKALCQKLSKKLMYLPGVPLWSAPQSAGTSAAKAVERFAEGIE